MFLSQKKHFPFPSCGNLGAVGAGLALQSSFTVRVSAGAPGVVVLKPLLLRQL